MQLGFAWAYYKITCIRKSEHGSELGELLMQRFPFNIYAMAEASDFKIGTLLGFAKARHKIAPRGKGGRDLGLGKLPKIWCFHLILNFLQQPRCPLSVS